MYWFYTSCNCQTTPPATAKAIGSGSVDFTLQKLNSVPGGYTANFYPGGGNVVAAVSPSKINWAAIGW